MIGVPIDVGFPYAITAHYTITRHGGVDF